MEQKAVRVLTSPYVTWYSNYGLFVPNEGQAFTPVLLHVNYKDAEASLIEKLVKFLKGPNPPVVLFTYGDRFANVSGLCADWQTAGFRDNVWCVLSLVNTKVGLTGGFATQFDNLPEEFEDLLNICNGGGKQVGLGSKVGESLGAAFNRPCASWYFTGKEEEVLLLKSILNNIKEYSFDYTLDATAITPSATEHCKCCGRKRGPLKYFAKIAAFLCPVCERRIKVIGPVNLTNWVVAQQRLQYERAVTQQANVLKQMRAAKQYSCPHCGLGLSQVNKEVYRCPCGIKYYLTNNRLLEVKHINQKKYVFAFSVRNTKQSKLISVTPEQADISSVIECEACNKDTTEWQWYVADRRSGVVHRVCNDCAKRMTNIKFVTGG